jgi:4-amino-4-deoxy-L-arabinose transferase-like glycosyltransferase
MILLVFPRGNFPINDDWSYSRSVKIFLETGSFRLTGWGSLPLLPQVIWGYLFCLVFGFSFEILRLSTLILSVMSLIFLYYSVSEYTDNRAIKFFAVIFIFSNPMFTASACTFMTDIPFFAVGMASVYFFLRYFHSENFRFLLPAIVFAIIAAFIRQIGLLFLLSFAIVFFFDKKTKKAYRAVPLMIFLAAVFALIVFQNSTNFVGASPFTNNTRVGYLKDSFSFAKLFGIIPLCKTGGMILIYLGVFASPILVLFSKRIYSGYHFTKKFFAYDLLFSSVILLLLCFTHKLLPLRPNVIWAYGIGPATLKDADYLLLRRIPFIPAFIWGIITFVGVFCGTLLLTIFIEKVRYLIKKSKPDNTVLYSSESFIGLFIVLYSIMLCFGEFYDRYLLIHLPLLALLFIRRIPEFNAKTEVVIFRIASGIIIVFGLFTVLSTHDYFSWNRNRWMLLDYTMNELHVNPESIDGGFEFNGWYCFDPLYKKSPEKSWWWVKDDSFLLTFSKMDNYSVVKSAPYYSWLFQQEVPVNLSIKMHNTHQFK